MINPLPPAFLFLLGALLIPFLKGKLKQLYLLFIPAVAFIDLLHLAPGTSWVYPFLQYELVFLRVDRLSLVIGSIFVVIGFLAMLYSLHVKEDGEHVAAFLYMGSSLGAVFAGDFFSLFVFWEIMAVTSVFLIWARKEKESLDAGFRYVFMHIFGGCCLFAGILIHVVSEGSILMVPLNSGWAYFFILIGFGLNAAFLPLHTWLPDAYPQGTVTGSIFLSVFTTKTGVYVLARCFPGAEILAYMGGAMAVFGVVFALLQNDTRKLLSYHIISQVGYMVAGIGVGTPLGINGGIAHLLNNVLYKTLLFMCMGSVIYTTGKRKLTELGGLARWIPVTFLTCLIASLSISGAPGFNGFVSKGMVISSASEAHKPVLELMLILASVGTFLSFTKLCHFTFFAGNREIKVREAPLNMQLAMMAIAFLCILIGVYPDTLFHFLPNTPLLYHAYTPSHIVGVIQLFLTAGLVFMLARQAFSPHNWLVLDFDYFYRMGFRWILWLCQVPLNGLRLRAQAFFSLKVGSVVRLSKNPFLVSEIALRYVRSKTGKASRYHDIFPEGMSEIYDENIYRKPMGLGVLLAMFLLFLYGLIYFIRS